MLWKWIHACSILWWLWFASYDSMTLTTSLWLGHDHFILLYNLYTYIYTYDKDDMTTSRWRWLWLYHSQISLRSAPGPHSPKAWQPTVAGAAWYKRLTFFNSKNIPFLIGSTYVVWKIGNHQVEISCNDHVQPFLGACRLVRRNPTLEQISKHMWFYQNQDKTIDCPWHEYYLEI